MGTLRHLAAVCALILGAAGAGADEPRSPKADPKVVGGVPALSISDAVPVAEGDSGTTGADFTITLSPASGSPVTVQADTADGTATLADGDYVQVLGQTVVFNPGETSKIVTVNIIGDSQIELDETFSLNLSNPIGATILDGAGLGTIVNDDFGGVQSPGELVHDSKEIVELNSQGGFPRPRFWRIDQPAYRSWEVVVDAVTGDVAAGLSLSRLDSDGITVLQNGIPVSGGSAVALRFKNTTGFPVGNQYIRAVANGCVACDQSDTVRIRAYDTTYRISRFNNSATQITLLVVSNSTDLPVAGMASFFRASDGVHLADLQFTLAPRATQVFNTATVPGLGGVAGSVEVMTDGPFGALTGKAVAVEPATGFTFDTAMVPRAASTHMVPRDN